MNKKVWITLLALLISVLVAYNIFALFFPEQFIMCLTDTAILKFGEFIESNVYVYWIVSILMTSIIYYLWSVVANKTFKLGLLQWLFIPIGTAITYIVATFASQIGVISNIAIMLAIFLISKQNYKQYILFYIINLVSQYLILFVRGYNEALPQMNFGSNLCLWFEGFILVLVFSIISIQHERRSKDELSMSTNN